MRATKAESNHERDMLTARWQTVHDMCSLIACNLAFEDCKDGDAYDLGKKPGRDKVYIG